MEKDKPNNHIEDPFLEHEDALWDEYDEDIPESRAISPILKLIALITVIAFFGLIFSTSWPGYQIPLIDLVKESLRLEKEIDTQKLQAAVVEINVVSGGAPLKSSAKKGTGFNINPEGLIVTNNHVIKDARNMTITFPDGSIYKAESWLPNDKFDLDLIKLNGKNLPAVPLNTQSTPQPGDSIRIVGNPLRLNNIVVEGKINGFINSEGTNLLSINAPIYPGNSGSPVFDKNGLVVGVVFASYNRKINGENKTFGLAFPIGDVLNML